MKARLHLLDVSGVTAGLGIFNLGSLHTPARYAPIVICIVLLTIGCLLLGSILRHFRLKLNIAAESLCFLASSLTLISIQAFGGCTMVDATAYCLFSAIALCLVSIVWRSSRKFTPYFIFNAEMFGVVIGVLTISNLYR
jgi:hypothetical protein